MSASTVHKLVTWLKATVPTDMLIPVMCGTKQPMFKHSTGEWSWARLDEYLALNPEHSEFAILMRRLCALDVDDIESMRAFESGFSELHTCPKEVTTKGAHYLFMRSPAADAAKCVNGARQVDREDHADFISVTGTGTAGVLVVGPSPGKRWERAPWDTPLHEISDGLLARIAKDRGRQHKKKASVLPPMAACTDAGGVPMVRDLLSLLAKWRWDDRACWFKIGAALRRAGGMQDPDLHKELFRELSRLSDKYDGTELDVLWASVASCEGPHLTLASVHAMAREDNVRGYDEWRQANVPQVAMDNWAKGDRGLASIAEAMLGDVVKMTGKSTYYFFDPVRCLWTSVDVTLIKKVISTCLDEILRDIDIDLAHRAQNGTDTERLKFEGMRKEARSRIRYVNENRGINGVMGFTSFRDDQFVQKLDGTPYLLGVRNGVVDLRTGKVRDREPSDMIFNVIDAAFDPAKDTSWWEGVVLSIMAGKQDNAAYLQKLMGYGITGETAEEIVLVCRGKGRNGKGVIFSMMQRLMGGFYKEMHPALIVDRECGNLDAERAQLQGCRLAVFNELKENEKLKTADMQMLSGGDGIPACPKYCDPITIQPRHLCVLTTNWMPQLKTVIPALQQRFVCLDFPVTFEALPAHVPETEFVRRMDNGLKDRMRGESERAQVLTWLVAGAKAWYATRDLKANPPPDVAAYTQAYFDGQDKLGAFITECCDVDPSRRVNQSALTDAFKQWADVNETTGFVDRMGLKGFVKKKLRIDGASVWGYTGLSLKPDPPVMTTGMPCTSTEPGNGAAYAFM